MPEIPVITIDGPSGTGKGVLCGYLADRLGWHRLDSGALYRVVAHVALSRGVALENDAELAQIASSLDVSFKQGRGESRVILDGNQDVSGAIRTETCGNTASQAAAHKAVRQALLQLQRQFRQMPGLVADGRDMGTVVFPDAGLKIFLTASPEVRADRRYKQLKDKGNSVNLARLSAEIKERDARDAGRSISPLIPAPDAIVIDTSELNIDEVCSRVAAEVEKVFRLP
ncbi:MAG: Cytidylate kinase [Gammaproteobacteria bacterium]|nr:Cytidylate kinase [Gammaproteobacteria bacterium]